jgi:hypothetical protein
LPAFDTDGKFIKIDQLEVSLTGSLVLVYFELRHYAIKKKKTDIIGSNTFSAIATQVKILERAIERQPSAYRSLILKGPILLPQSPSKRKDQMAAARAFHPGKCQCIVFRSFHPFHIWLAITMPAASTSKIPQQDRPLSKTDGKKREADHEDEEATATDGETTVPENPAKKRKKGNAIKPWWLTCRHDLFHFLRSPNSPEKEKRKKKKLNPSCNFSDVVYRIHVNPNLTFKATRKDLKKEKKKEKKNSKVLVDGVDP